MVDTFNPPIPPQEGPSGEVNYNAVDVRFGEGYVASFTEGMNEEFQSWPLTWKGTDTEIQPIVDFFRAHKGYISFYWTPPFGVQGLYRVKNFAITPEAAGNASVSATFMQVYAP